MCVLDRDHCTVASSEDLSHSKSKSVMIVALCFAALDGGGIASVSWSKQRGRTDQRSCKCDSNVTLKRGKGGKW